MNVYRIGKKKSIKDLSGEGARFYGGRWNYSGYRVLYASESIPLAILEYITKTKTGAVEEELINLSIAYIKVKNDVSFSTIKIEDLPEDWNTYPVPEDLKKIGTDWIISIDPQYKNTGLIDTSGKDILAGSIYAVGIDDTIMVK